MLEKLSRTTRLVLGKIIIKVLLIPGVNRWFDQIVEIYEVAQVEKERGAFTSKQVCLDFRHYLPDTKERIERLRRVINKRPVAVILPGASVRELEKRIAELEDQDICYFGLNSFIGLEKYILQKINRNFSVVMYSGISSATNTEINDVINFIERQEDNIFISAMEAFRQLETTQGFQLRKFIKKYDKKLLFITVSTSFITIRNELYFRFPCIEYPLHFSGQNTFSISLLLALIGEASKVVIFGGDGGRINGRELYFRECGGGDPDSVLEQSLMIDTRVFNVTMPFILEKIYKMYSLRPVDIINCSVQSHYTPLRKLSYDETFALLKLFKKDTS